MSIKNEVSDAGYLLWVVIVFSIVACVSAGILQMAGFISFGFFAPKVEEIRRQTFEESRAYREGIGRHLDGLCIEWMTATDPVVKGGLESALRHQLIGVPESALSGCARRVKSTLEN